MSDYNDDGSGYYLGPIMEIPKGKDKTITRITYSTGTDEMPVFIGINDVGIEVYGPKGSTLADFGESSGQDCTCDACLRLRKESEARRVEREAKQEQAIIDNVDMKEMERFVNETMKPNMGKAGRPNPDNGNMPLEVFMDELMTKLDKLHSVINGMEDRLAPVLGPHPPQADKVIRDDSPRSPLAEKMSLLIDDVSHKIELVEQINYRLEL